MGGLVALWGDQHPDLDRVADARLDERTAVALSRGRFPKPYPHVDPNEDAVLAASGPGGRLLAVADGHFGFDAARAAMGAVGARVSALVEDPDGDPVGALEETCRAALDAVADVVAAVEPPRDASRCALTLALATGEHLYAVTYGDTACVRGRGGRDRLVGRPGWPFLGAGAGVPPVDRARLRPRDRVAVCSDGLTTYLGRAWPARIAAALDAAEDPLAAARELIEMAMDGGAGDHIAVGVLL